MSSEEAFKPERRDRFLGQRSRVHQIVILPRLFVKSSKKIDQVPIVFRVRTMGRPILTVCGVPRIIARLGSRQTVANQCRPFLRGVEEIGVA